mmetsp:Transcript_29123/g.40009  ORF Transcript_29123/g.40009 Transcript_29123/m.40009 type:complete len:116 (+) Transcript_29123:1767-2114(+)
MMSYSESSGPNKMAVKSIAEAIRENVLNLQCPHCQKVYEDFEGCLAVTCSFCSKYFCGLCHHKSDSNGDAHSHARWNGQQNYFSNVKDVAKARLRMRSENFADLELNFQDFSDFC